MYTYIIKANWQDYGAKVQDLITPFASHDNFAVIYNTDPEIDKIYFATTDERIISELATGFELEEVASIDFTRDFKQTGTSQWEVKGNKALVNF